MHIHRREVIDQWKKYLLLLKKLQSLPNTGIQKLDNACLVVFRAAGKFSRSDSTSQTELMNAIDYLYELVYQHINFQNLNKKKLSNAVVNLKLLLEEYLPKQNKRVNPITIGSTSLIQNALPELKVAIPPIPLENKTASFTPKDGNRVKHYSNLSDDCYGINGGFADIMDAVANAKSTLFIQGWLFEPDVVLPIQRNLRPALALHSKNQFREAAEAYEVAIRSEPENSYAYFFAGIANIQIENFDRANELFQRGIQLNPTCEDFYYGLILSYMNQSNDKAIEQVYQQAKQNNVIFKTAHLLIVYAQFLIKQNRLHEASQIIERAKRVNNNININRVEALLFEKQGKFIEANNAIQIYLRNKPSDHSAIVKSAHLQICLAKTASEKEAVIKDYKEMAFNNYSNQLAVDLAATYLELNKLDEAADLLLTTIKGGVHGPPPPSDPYNLSARILLAKVYEQKNEVNLALENYRIALQINPHDTAVLESYKNLKCPLPKDFQDIVALEKWKSSKEEVENDIKKWQEAAKQKLEELNVIQLQQFICDNPHRSDAMLLLADKAAESKNSIDRIQYYEQALNLHPYDPDVRNNIANKIKNFEPRNIEEIISFAQWAGAKNHALAEKLLLSILQAEDEKKSVANPNHWRALQALGLIYERQGQNDKALLKYELAVKINPLDSHTKGLFFDLLKKLQPDKFEARQKAIEKYSYFVKDFLSRIDELPLEQLIKFAKSYPFSQYAYLKIGDLLLGQNNNEEAANYYKKAYDLNPHDNKHTALHRLIKLYEKSNQLDMVKEFQQKIAISDEQQIVKAIIEKDRPLIKDMLKVRAQEIGQSTPLQAFVHFADGYYAFKHAHPCLGEVLIKKALENPNMIIAINLWNNQRECHQESFARLEAIAKQKFGLERLPANLSVRMVSKEGVFHSFHQKYIVMDDGSHGLKSFYGGSDLASGKFDWDEHPLIDTPETPLWTAFGANGWQNNRLALDTVDGNMPRSGWRDVQSQLQGPACADLAADFVGHWSAGKGNAMTAHRVDTHSTAAVAKHWDKVSKELKFNSEEKKEDHTTPLWKCQVVRSANSSNYKEWKLPEKYEKSLQDAYLSAIKKAEKFIYLETQYFSGDTEHGNSIPRALIDKICEKARLNQPFHLYMSLPMCPNGEPGGKVTVEPLRHTQWKIMQKMMHEVEQRTGKPWSDFMSFNFYAKWHGPTERYKELREREKPIPPQTKTETFLTRCVKVVAAKLINPPTPEKKPFSQRFIDFLLKQKSKQPDNSRLKKILNYLVKKLISFCSSTKQTKAQKEKYEITFKEKALVTLLNQLIAEMKLARNPPIEIKKRIERLENLAHEINERHRKKEFCLDCYNQILIEFNGPKRNDLVSESHRYPIYIHSKLMIVDDTIMINGSANLNARSMAGKDADGEIAVLQEAQPGHEEACLAEARAFRRKIWEPYFGTRLMGELKEEGFNNPHLPENRGHIQRRAQSNLDSFAGDQPAEVSTRETGLVCTFPLVKEFGHVGELQSQHRFIPDTAKKDQQPGSIYQYFPAEGSKPVAKVLADAVRYKPFH